MTTYEQIVANIGKTISSLTSTSNSAIWRRLAAVFAETINTVLLNQSNSEVVIETAARTLRVMGKQYYIDTALAFQTGDNLVVVDPSKYAYGYETVDPAKQIIKQVAIRVDAQKNVINMHVCTQDANGNNVALTAEQLAEFSNYMTAKSAFGISMMISSPTPSIITTTQLFIRYLDTYSLSQIKNSVKEILITTQGTLLGDSPVFVNDIETALAGVPGVRDAYFVGITCDGAQPTNGILTPASGYFNFSAALQNLTDIVVFNPIR